MHVALGWGTARRQRKPCAVRVLTSQDAYRVCLLLHTHVQAQHRKTGPALRVLVFHNRARTAVHATHTCVRECCLTHGELSRVRVLQQQHNTLSRRAYAALGRSITVCNLLGGWREHSSRLLCCCVHWLVSGTLGYAQAAPLGASAADSPRASAHVCLFG